MALYDTLFAMMDLQASQLLVTPRDFRDENFKVNLRETTEELLSVSRVIPVFNENDAISDRSLDKVCASLAPRLSTALSVGCAGSFCAIRRQKWACSFAHSCMSDGSMTRLQRYMSISVRGSRRLMLICGDCAGQVKRLPGQ